MRSPHQSLVKLPESMFDPIAKKYLACRYPGRENDRCGVHYLSSIPNLHFTKVIAITGWHPRIIQLYYEIMTELESDANFHDYKELFLDKCQTKFKNTICEEINQAFNQLGIQ